jgi:hypothetical protein
MEAMECGIGNAEFGKLKQRVGRKEKVKGRGWRQEIGR